MSNQIESCEYTANPIDNRCRFWAKIVRADDALPLPSAVGGASDVPGAYMRKGESDEVFEGDFVLIGEERHHRKQRGWDYWLKRVQGGELVDCSFGTESDAKMYLRGSGQKDLLKGAGQCAAMIREIHVRRMRAVERLAAGGVAS